MPTFVVLLRHDPSRYAGFSADQFAALIKKYRDWSAPLIASGTIEFGRKLVDDRGKSVRKDGDQLVVKDGPFNETKEFVGGVYVMKADGYARVIELLRDHPHYSIGGTIEVRQIDFGGGPED